MRLTPQFINLCLPHKHSGQLRSCMVHTLRALQSSPSALLNTMDVFVKEPSVDWKVSLLHVQCGKLCVQCEYACIVLLYTCTV